MDAPGSTPDVTVDDVRELFDRTGEPATPYTTEEVAEALECPRGSALGCLEELARADEIRTKQVADASSVWWKPGANVASDRQSDEEQFSAFVSAVKDYAIFTLDTDGTIVTWNEGAERIKGYSADEIIGEHFSTFYTEDDIAEGVPEYNLETAAAEGRVEDEGWRVRQDGSRFWANVTITAFRDEEGTLQGFTKVTRDMTERREYEQQLEEQAARLEKQRDELEQELDTVFDRIDDAFYALDDEFRFEYVNDRTEEYLGKSTAELLGQKPWEVLDVDESNSTFEHLKTAMATQEPASFEQYSDVLGIWTMIRIYPSESGLSVYFRDISDRKERERELERAHDLLEKTERIADVGGWEINPDTLDVFWTEHLFDILTVPYDEEPPLDEALDVYHEEDRAVVESAVEEALESGSDFDIEVRFTPPDGDVRWLRVKGDPEVEDGSVESLRGAVQDVTERKERERELEESNERLQQFAYAASHDLQEPLRMVSSYLQLLERRYAEQLDEDAREFIEFAVDGADRMREMINGLLEYSRVDTEGAPLEPVDLDTVLEDVVADLQIRIDDQNAELSIAELPEVQGDARQLRQLFQNLLENAIEYSGDGPPQVQVSATRADDDWIVSVSDEGVGIDPEDQERIFEVFQRLHTADEHAGTGIGLALCKRIAERHGGDIWVESEPDAGATFSVSLPATEE